MDRSKQIVKTSTINILINFCLVLIKAGLGAFTGSIAVIMEAVNNFSDALSSIITIVGTRLAKKAPDKKHPYGYGRIEYISTVLISFMILIAGGSAVKESIEFIINKDRATYTPVTILILLIAMVVKFAMAANTKRVGRELNAKSLMASGQESFFDACLSVGTLIAALMSFFFGLSIEGFLGAAIGIVIIKSGAETLSDTVGNIIGLRTEKDLSTKVKKMVGSYDHVLGVYDVMLHNYGPSQHMGSIHIEVDENLTAKDIHVLSQRITRDIYEELDIIITIGIYASIGDDENAKALRNEVTHVAHSHPEVLQIHGFFIDNDLVGFDIVIDFKYDAVKIINEVNAELTALHPEYKYLIVLDLDYSD